MRSRLSASLNKLKRAPRAFKARCQRKTDVVALLRKHKQDMAAGWYLVKWTYSGAIARRLGSRLPRSLKEAKWYWFARRREFLDSLLKWFTDAVIPPYLGNICILRLGGAPYSTSKSGTVALISRHGDIKIFLKGKASIITYVSDRGRFNKLKTAHRTLKNYLPLVETKIIESECGVIEHFFDGAPIDLVPIDQQYHAYQILLQGWSRLIKDNRSPPWGRKLAKEATQLAIRSTTSLPWGWLIAGLQDEIDTVLASSAVVPSHGDLHRDNVLVNRGGPAVIDLELFRPLPFFYDVLTLALIHTRRGLKDESLLCAVLSGNFDEDLDYLCRAAEAPAFSGNRMAYLLSILVISLYESLSQNNNANIERLLRPFPPVEFFHRTTGDFDPMAACPTRGSGAPTLKSSVQGE